MSLALDPAALVRLMRPPGTLILPAETVRSFGSPSCLRSRFVNVRSSRDGGGGGVASRDDIDESELMLMEEGEPGMDIVRGGVSM